MSTEAHKPAPEQPQEQELLTFCDWYARTKPGVKGLTQAEFAHRVALRKRVIAAAKTSQNTLAGAYSRRRVGLELLKRLEEATASDPLRVSAAATLGLLDDGTAKRDE